VAAVDNIAALCRARVVDRGHAVFLTYYDDAGDERTELSYATFDNWASKSANLLNEELGVGRGAHVWLTVTDHWTAAVIVVATWKLGAVVRPARKPRAGADDVVVVDEAGAATTAHPPARLLTLGRGMGGRTSARVPGLAFGEEVSAFADDYDDPDVTLDDPALNSDGQTLRQGELLTAAAAGSLHRDDRLLTTRPLESAAAIVDGLVAPLLAGASVVWSVATAPDALARRASEERVTVTLDQAG
jgi:uncharacterized protein (TIGR03089 family)